MSLRKTAFLWMAGLMSAVGLTAALVSYLLVQREAADFLDNQLRQIALYVGDVPTGAATPTTPAMPHDPEDDFVIQVWDRDGKPMRLSHPEVALPRRTTTGFSQAVTTEDEWRLYTLISDDRTVQIAQQMSVREELATDAALQAAAPIALLIPLSWLILNVIIGRIMGRLDRLASAVGARDAANGTPIPLDDVPTEVAPFVASINELLARLHALLERQRRFVSDAAHELRTPLAALRIQIGNLAAARDGVAAERLVELSGGIRRASALVAQLLKLAHYDANEPAVEYASFDLAALTIDCVARAIPLAEDRSIDLGVVQRTPVNVVAVANDFEVVINNLLDNAIRYTPAGGSVDVSIAMEGTTAVVEVRDTGPGIAPGDLARIFERFFRAGPSDVEGTGLGLAIAKAAAERSMAALSVENRKDRSGLIARLRVRASSSSKDATL